MNKNAVFGAGCAVLSLLSPAFAADLPTKAETDMLPFLSPSYNWSGFYAGLNGGYGFGTSRWYTNAASTDNFSIDGYLIGGTLGYNFQLGAFVAGVEGDYGFSDITGRTVAGCPAGCRTRNSWLGTGRLRIGYAFDRLLPYVTGGVAFGDVKSTSVLGSSTSTEVGWTVGGGVEWGFFTNWSAKAEYLYVDLANGSCTGACSPVPIAVNYRTSLMRGGINYRF